METDLLNIGLQDYCSSRDAVSLKNKLIEALGSNIALDAEHVETIPTPILQVILAASKQWQASDETIVLTNTSDEVRKDIELLGLAENELFSEVAI